MFLWRRAHKLSSFSPFSIHLLWLIKKKVPSCLVDIKKHTRRRQARCKAI
jgi:hypothetical protein